MNLKKKVLLKVLYSAAFCIIIYNFIYFINTTITKQNFLSIHGISFLPIKNEIIITRKIEIESIQVEDEIAYYYNGNFKVATINNIYFDVDKGKRMFSSRTQGYYYPDVAELSKECIIGRKINTIKHIGWLTKLLQSKLITIISVMFLLWQYYFNKFRFKAEKKRRIKKKYINEP